MMAGASFCAYSLRLSVWCTKTILTLAYSGLEPRHDSSAPHCLRVTICGRAPVMRAAVRPVPEDGSSIGAVTAAAAVGSAGASSAGSSATMRTRCERGGRACGPRRAHLHETPGARPGRLGEGTRRLALLLRDLERGGEPGAPGQAVEAGAQVHGHGAGGGRDGAHHAEHREAGAGVDGRRAGPAAAAARPPAAVSTRSPSASFTVWTATGGVRAASPSAAAPTATPTAPPGRRPRGRARHR